jgi:hypothetical protein
MTKKQLVHALRRTYRQFDKQTIESVVSETWMSFDECKCDKIGKGYLMRPQTGMIDTINMVLTWSM